jgi:hypothetical protein
VVFLAKGEQNTMDANLTSFIPLFFFLPSIVDPINNREVQGLYLLDQFGVGLDNLLLGGVLLLGFQGLWEKKEICRG